MNCSVLNTSWLSRVALALVISGLASCQAVLGIDDVSGRQEDADPGEPDGEVPDAAAPDAAPPSSCPDVFTEEYNGHRYFLSSDEMTRDEAVVDCAASGGHLAVIDDTGENDFLTAMLVSNSWIGYDDRTQEGRFDWLTGAQPGYSNWNEGEPNNANGEDCGGILGPNAFGPEGTWNDFDCNLQQTYLCECDVAIEPSAVPDCMSDPAYSVILRGRRYHWANMSASWQDARNYCLADGADLVVINDADEQYWVFDAISSTTWLGLWDRGEDGAGPFEWVNGDSTFFNWAFNEPNDQLGQHHALMSGSDGRWHDASGDSSYSVMCECDPESPVKNY